MKYNTSHLSRSHACETAVMTELVHASMMFEHLVEDLPLLLLPGPLPKRASFLRFPTSLLVTCPKYTSRNTPSLTSCCTLMTIEMLVCRAVQGILRILHQTQISKALILFLPYTFHILHVSAAYRKTEKTSDSVSLLLVYLEILPLHVT